MVTYPNQRIIKPNRIDLDTGGKGFLGISHLSLDNAINKLNNT